MNNRKLGAVVVTALITSAAAFAVGSGKPTVGSNDDAVTVVSGAPDLAPVTGMTTEEGVDWAAAHTSINTAQPPQGFAFGVQTHFSQGWNTTWLDLTAQINANTLRDTVNWASVEKRTGVYDFSGAAVATLDKFCGRGGRISLTIVPKNSLYDAGYTVYTAAGQAGYANYLTALAGRFGQCLTAIEVGNEINGPSGLSYPAGTDRAAAYVGTLRALYAKVKLVAPYVSVLGGSTVNIGTGFLDTLFAAGMYSVIDGVAVHPYRPESEGIDLEVAHLNDVMRKYGSPKPIWATEFSYGFDDQRKVAGAMLKSVVQMYAAGITRANWYAMVEQKTFPNMGLFSASMIKPAGVAFRTAVETVLPYGQPQRIDTGGRPLYLYRIGTDHWVVWGGAGTISFGGAATVRDMFGSVIPASGGRVTIGADPVIVDGATSYAFEDSSVLADSLIQYGAAPWSYMRRDKGGKDVPLDWFDNDYTSFFGDRWSKPLRINNSSGAPAGDGTNPMRAVVRYTAPRAMQVDLGACLSKPASGDGVDYRVERNGVRVASGVLVDRVTVSGVKMMLAAGDRVDVSFGPNQTYGGDSFNYRIVIANSSVDASRTCSGL